MASIGMGRSLSQRVTRSRGRLVSAWIFQRRSVSSQPRSGLGAAQSPTPTEAMTMRFYNQPHRFYAGGDLHARTLYLHVLDDQGRTRIRTRMTRSPDGPLAEPTSNWDDAIDGSRLLASRRSRFLPTTARRQPREVDPADLPGGRAARRRFWGVTPVSPSGSPRQRWTWPDPVNRFDADRCGRPTPNDPGARSNSEGQTHLELHTRKAKKLVSVKGTYLDVRGH